jgi:hypothetical protein
LIGKTRAEVVKATAQKYKIRLKDGGKSEGYFQLKGKLVISDKKKN